MDSIRALHIIDVFCISNIPFALFIKIDVNFTVYGSYQRKTLCAGSESHVLNLA